MNKEKWIERCADALDELSDKEASDFMFNEYGQMLADRWRDYSVIDLKEELELIKSYKKKNLKQEDGAASLLVVLENGKIKVYHGTDKTFLFERDAIEGDWDKIFNTIRGDLNAKLG